MAGGANTPHCTSEPCIGSTYMSLYNASAVGVKAVHSSLQVGGRSPLQPSTGQHAAVTSGEIAPSWAAQPVAPSGAPLAGIVSAGRS